MSEEDPVLNSYTPDIHQSRAFLIMKAFVKLLKINPIIGAFGALAEEQNIDHTDPDAGPLESFFSLWQHYAERGIPNTANRCSVRNAAEWHVFSCTLNSVADAAMLMFCVQRHASEAWKL